MNQSENTPLNQHSNLASQRTPRDNVPPAWYDLSCRIGSALAVADMASDYCFSSLTPNKDECERNARIVSALHDLIQLCSDDVLQLEQQLLRIKSDS